MKRSIIRFLMGIIVCSLFSCGEEVLPKPQGMLRLSYPTPAYEEASINCFYTFEKNNIAKFQKAKIYKKCWYNMYYPKLKGTIYISYYAINNDLDSLLRNSQNLTQEHFIKADAIQPKDFEYPEKDVYGRIYEVTGNAASSCQFYITDNTKHFVSGSVYFEVKPNYDSILPAAKYLQNDVIHFMESIQWKE